LYDDLLRDAPADVAYVRSGTLYVSRTESSLAAGAQQANRLQTLGIRAMVLDCAQARAREPTLSDSIAGGVWYPEDGRLQPLNLVRYVAELARAQGAEFRTEAVTSFALGSHGVTGVRTSANSFEADRVVVAAGSWSPAVAKSLGLRVPILPAKGYSFDLRLADPPRTSMLFVERHVSATPMNDVTRATTGLDFHGGDARVRQARIDLIHTAYNEYLAAPRIVAEGPAWAGFRPLTPDGLPIIGSSSRVGNLIFATGHGPLGVTLAPATAEAAANAALNTSPAVAEAFSPARFRL
jgi:D-amino-acid dehydrogenase